MTDIVFVLAFCFGIFVLGWWISTWNRYYSWSCPICGYEVMTTEKNHLKGLVIKHEAQHARSRWHGRE